MDKMFRQMFGVVTGGWYWLRMDQCCYQTASTGLGRSGLRTTGRAAWLIPGAFDGSVDGTSK
jgi:hypothetical protein